VKFVLEFSSTLSMSNCAKRHKNKTKNWWY